MEERINQIFDNKITVLKDLSNKNSTKMHNLKDDLKLTIMKLKCEMNKLTIAELKNELKDMKAAKVALGKEISELKNDLQTLKDLCGEDCKHESKMKIKDIFSPSNFLDHELFKLYFKDIGQATKYIQEELQRNDTV